MKKNLGIKRFGSAFAPMEATLGICVIDISWSRIILNLIAEGHDTVRYAL